MSTSCILGAGGASRAIAFGILEEGGRVTLTDVDAPRAAALARDLKVEAIPLDAVAQCPAAILVNATPVGMEPKVDDIPIDPGPAGTLPVGDGHRLPAARNPAAPGGQGPGLRHHRRPADAHPPGHGPVRAVDRAARAA